MEVKGNIDVLAVNNIRALSIAMIEKANSGHPGGPMGGADFMHILYTEFLKFDPLDMEWAHRDRFFMDAGHLSALMYAQYHLLGNYTMEDLKNFRQWGSPTPGHPEVDVKRGVENTSGPLGQGHTMGVGAAIAAKFLNSRFPNIFDHTIYGYITDGGIQEEISQGAGRIAGHLGLDNFVLFYDSNEVQLSTMTKDVSSEDTAKKYEAWGWNVITIDGHDHSEIRKALDIALNEKEKPTLIIGRTIIGKGCLTETGDVYEGKCELHGKPIGNTKADYKRTLLNLGGDPTSPFDTYPEVKKLYQKVLEKKEAEAKQKRQYITCWGEKNPELLAKMVEFLSGKLPDIDFSTIEHRPNIATREASSNVLASLANQMENVIVSSADLSNSDKTDGFLKHSLALSKGNFSGGFLQAGVAELTMAAIANGIALHGGVTPVVATFFVFSDYMKPAIRLSAIQELPVKYVWTHDSFRVGEDGPTHQPVEQEAQIRLLEKIKNHSGTMSMQVLRPADAAETSVAWEMAMNNTKTPTGLILSRQAIQDIVGQSNERYLEAENAKKGGYLVKDSQQPDITLVGNGSEVGTLLEAAKLLETSTDVRINVASIISEGLFGQQTKQYQESVLPSSNHYLFGLTAGLPINLQTLVGSNGKVTGMEHFGYSAPASVLDAKFGFTGVHVAEEIKKFLEKVGRLKK